MKIYYYAYCVSVVFLAVSCSHAQNPTAYDAQPQVAAIGFYEDLTRLSKEAKVTFVVEGIPFSGNSHPKNAEKSVSSLNDAVERVAQSYDYTWKRVGNIFVLSKKFSQPQDLPDVTFEEWQGFLKDILLTLDNVMPSVEVEIEKERKAGIPSDVNAYFVRQFYSSLSVDQRKQLEKGSETGSPALFVNSLNSEQREMIARLLSEADFDKLKEATQNLYFMSQIRKDWLLKSADVRGGSLIGFEVSNFGRRFLIPFSGTASDLLSFSEKDKTNADLKRPIVFTLDEMAKKFNNLNRYGNNVTLSIDKDVARKRIMLIGVEYADKVTIFRKSAEIYNLRVRAMANHVIAMGRPVRKIPKSLATVFASILSSLPGPLSRAGHLGALETFVEEAQKLSGGPTNPQALQKDELKITGRPDQMARTAAIQLLRRIQISSPSLSQKLTRGIPADSLMPSQRDLSIFAFSSRFLQTLLNRRTVPSDGITHFDSVYLTGRHRGAKLSLEIGTADAQGEKDTLSVIINSVNDGTHP